MFENIIGQEQTVSQLIRDITSGEFPASVLLHGPQYSGKLSVGLEIARALTCESGTAEWNCRCRSCVQQRQLTHQDTMLLGSRYFLQEILASGESLRRNRKEPSQFLYVRALRKLLRRFDSVLWEGEENRLTKITNHLVLLQETAEELSPGSPLPAETRLEKALSRALSAAEKVCSALVTDNIPVNMIRRATFWAHMTTQGNRKIILVENADAMQASSRNALLKILEEPPAGVYFLLITTRRGAIMPTILSRTRSYSLRDRSLDDTQRVLERIFRLPGEGCATMRDFFLRMEFSGTADIRLLVHGFIQAVQASAPDISVVTTVGTTLKAAPTRTAFRYFLEELTRQGSAELRNIEGDTRHRDMRRLEKWNRIMHEHMTRVDQFNMNAEMALETLYYELRRVD